MNPRNIYTPTIDAIAPHGVTDKPSIGGVLLFNIMEEIWKDIPLFEGVYQISNHGRVRSLDRMVNTSYSDRECRGMFLKPRLKVGYVYVCLCNAGTEKDYRLHRILAEVFIPNPYSKPQINHKNGIKSDNRIENLEWVTASENILHSFRVLNRVPSKAGLGKTGVLSSQSKRVLNIQSGDTYVSIKECAEQNGMIRKNLARMLSGKRRNKTNFRYETSYSK